MPLPHPQGPPFCAPLGMRLRPLAAATHPGPLQPAPLHHPGSSLPGRTTTTTIPSPLCWHLHSRGVTVPLTLGSCCPLLCSQHHWSPWWGKGGWPKPWGMEVLSCPVMELQSPRGTFRQLGPSEPSREVVSEPWEVGRSLKGSAGGGPEPLGATTLWEGGV